MSSAAPTIITLSAEDLDQLRVCIKSRSLQEKLSAIKNPHGAILMTATPNPTQRPLDMGLVFISRLHCRRSSFCQCNRLCGYSLVFYGRRFLFLRAKLKPGFRGQVLANQGPRVQLFGEESRMLLPKLAKRNESNHSLLPFFCASLM